MAKKTVIRLTEGQLAEIIKDITLKSLNEIDGATYSRVYNASHRAKNDNQNGQLQRTVGNRTRNNDDILAHARELEPRAKESLRKPPPSGGGSSLSQDTVFISYSIKKGNK